MATMECSMMGVRIITSNQGDGAWRFRIGPTEWLYNPKEKIPLHIMRNGAWEPVAMANTLNYGICFAIGFVAAMSLIKITVQLLEVDPDESYETRYKLQDERR